MARYLKKLLVFLLIPIFYWIAIGLYNMQHWGVERCLDLDERILIAGDSHAQHSVNSSHFPAVLNTGTMMEPYYITYWKLKAIHSHIDLEQVVVSIGPHNLSRSYSNLLGQNTAAKYLLKTHYSVFHWPTVFSINVDYVQLIRSIWKENCLIPKKAHCNSFPDYKPEYQSRLDPSAAWGRHFGRHESDLDDELTLPYLDSIALYCERNDLDLILLNTPVHSAYRKMIPEFYSDELRTCTRRLQSRGHRYIDISTYALTDDQFKDSDHLNAIGMDSIARVLADSLAWTMK